MQHSTSSLPGQKHWMAYTAPAVRLLACELVAARQSRLQAASVVTTAWHRFGRHALFDRCLLGLVNAYSEAVRIVQPDMEGLLVGFGAAAALDELVLVNDDICHYDARARTVRFQQRFAPHHKYNGLHLVRVVGSHMLVIQWLNIWGAMVIDILTGKPLGRWTEMRTVLDVAWHPVLCKLFCLLAWGEVQIRDINGTLDQTIHVPNARWACALAIHVAANTADTADTTQVEVHLLSRKDVRPHIDTFSDDFKVLLRTVDLPLGLFGEEPQNTTTCVYGVMLLYPGTDLLLVVGVSAISVVCLRTQTTKLIHIPLVRLSRFFCVGPLMVHPRTGHLLFPEAFEEPERTTQNRFRVVVVPASYVLAAAGSSSRSYQV